MSGVTRECHCPRISHHHGTERHYQHHKCRCFRCCFAHSEAGYVYRGGGTLRHAEWAPTVGVRRRLQALARIGWSPSMLAGMTDLSAEYLSKLRTDANHDLIRVITYRTICRLYDALWDKPVNTTRGRRVITFAVRADYAPPVAWDDESIDDPAASPSCPPEPLASERPLDEIAVEEAIRGGRVVHLTPAERNEAVRRLTERGCSAREIADRLSTTKRSVIRRRTAVRTETPAPPCGTRPAFRRHKRLGEPVDTACELAERDYQREHKRSIRAARREAA